MRRDTFNQCEKNNRSSCVSEFTPARRLEFLKAMAEKWPSAIVARTEIEKFSGGMLKGPHLANLACPKAGAVGPPSIKIGRKVGYEVSSLLSWMESQIK
ncbi:MAG: hypothetical protein C4518_08445 [Desulfobacteraceae bacterium]|nr:MAG: hypothetical protein C4518_08445 [Desulfobacteraceae bacterium]